MRTFYNDSEPTACAWLSELVNEGLITDGYVDSRSIVDVQPEDIRGYGRVHWFAGIGGWDYALQLAGWPEEWPVWTGSCPCQPFSTAGKGKAEKDERHLWPEFRRLIAKCRPAVIFGEQVASKLGRAWLAGVRADLEALDYAFGAADLCASGTAQETGTNIGGHLYELVEDSIGYDAANEFYQWWLESGNYALYDTTTGAPHIRQRLYWVAYSHQPGCNSRGEASGCQKGTGSRTGSGDEAGRLDEPYRHGWIPGRLHTRPGGLQKSEMEQSGADRLAHSPDDHRRSGKCESQAGIGPEGKRRRRSPGGSDTDWVGNVPCARLEEWERSPAQQVEGLQPERYGSWDESRPVLCRDGKTRRIPLKPAFFPLAHGVPGRVAQLRGLGNSIVPQVAAAFIQAVIDFLGRK